MCKHNVTPYYCLQYDLMRGSRNRTIPRKMSYGADNLFSSEQGGSNRLTGTLPPHLTMRFRGGGLFAVSPGHNNAKHFPSFPRVCKQAAAAGF